MKLILTSTIEYIEKAPKIWDAISQMQNITFLPLAMPLEMENDAEWQTFYGQNGQLRHIYEAPFQKQIEKCKWLNIFTMSENEMCERIMASDCIIMVGGDPKALKERLQLFSSLYQALTLSNQYIIGVSAGAKIWFSEMFVEHEDGDGQIHLEITEGIGYFQTKQALAAHVDFSQAQMERLYALLQQTTIEEIIAIGNDGLLFYDTESDVLELEGSVKIFQ